ncbi:MAG: hypothetical protein EB060_03755 [Proteobacteria bacterium]|nr:hypothetical protein [Pseudomonadota bacterium]
MQEAAYIRTQPLVDLMWFYAMVITVFMKIVFAVAVLLVSPLILCFYAAAALKHAPDDPLTEPPPNTPPEVVFTHHFYPCS